MLNEIATHFMKYLRKTRWFRGHSAKRNLDRAENFINNFRNDKY